MHLCLTCAHFSLSCHDFLNNPTAYTAHLVQPWEGKSAMKSKAPSSPATPQESWPALHGFRSKMAPGTPMRQQKGNKAGSSGCFPVFSEVLTGDDAPPNHSSVWVTSWWRGGRWDTALSPPTLMFLSCLSTLPPPYTSLPIHILIFLFCFLTHWF